MLNKDLEEIDLNDLQQLVTDRVPEGKTIEYKAEFYRLDSKDEKDRVRQHEEMLKDVSSFANTLGGDLIIGIKQDDGTAGGVCGFETPDGADKLKLRVLDLMQKWLEPRVALAIHSIPVEPDRSVLVIRVWRSPIGPHRVIYQGKFGPFWARHSSGTYEMDTDDLRQAFTHSASLEERVEEYREERIRAVVENQTPVDLQGRSRIICHLIPLDAFTSRLSLSIPEFVGQLVNYPQFQFTQGRTPMIEMDGVVACDAIGAGIHPIGYVYAFKSGVIESVGDDLIHYSPQDTARRLPLFKVDYPRAIIDSFRYYLSAYQNLNVQPPIICSFTLTGVRGMYVDNGGFDRHPKAITRDVLRLPTVEISDAAEVDTAALLKPVFDALWNASGHEQCFQYDEAGKFRRVR
jgi:hypothetical protein